MHIHEVKISEVKKNPNNPRTIKDDKFAKLVQSIREFPEMLRLRPIVVNDDMVVLGGNMRLKACKEAGLKVVPIIKASDLTEDQQRQFIIKDNVGFGEWDWEMLANEWDADKLGEWGLDLPDMDVKVLDAEEDDFDVPDGGIETDIVPGDLFEIGAHRLLCGDSTDADAVARLMNGEKADISFTSPPYNVGGSVDNKKGEKKMYINSNDDLDNYDKFLQSALNITFIYSNYSFFNLQLLSNNMQDITKWVGENYMFLKDIFVWNKKNCPPNIIKGSFSTKFELIYCFDQNHKGGRNFPCKWQGKYANVIDLETNLGNQETDLHRAGYPVSFPSWFIEKLDFVKSVLDIFLGTGTTMVAAHQLGRKCYGMELDPKYCQVIVDRMRKLDPALEIKRNGKLYK